MSRRDRTRIDFSSLEASTNDPSSTTQYRISALLRGHTDDVRALTSAPDGTLYSASRDGTVKSWRTTAKEPNGQQGRWELRRTWEGLHTGFVNSVRWVGKERSETGLLCTGGQDSLIQVVSLSTPDAPPRTLLGHGHNVCCLHASADGKRLVSYVTNMPRQIGATLKAESLLLLLSRGSWDCTARIWDLDSGECLQVLTDHTAAVWDGLCIDVKGYEGTVVTACADGLIRSFRDGQRKQLFKGHEGPVRALAKITPEVNDGLMFASASNDGTIRIWHLDGTELNVLDGHDSFIYSLVSIPSSSNGGLASSGEDGIIRIWNEEDGGLDQEVLVPPLSVWSLTTLADGDLACGCSDDCIWVFTRDEVRRGADEGTRVAYESGLKERERMQKLKEGMDDGKNEMPKVGKVEELENAGTKQGEVKLVETEKNGVHAFMWDGTTWEDVGQVVSQSSRSPASKSTERMQHEGVEYDYVFSIDTKDDEPPLKLPYNIGGKLVLHSPKR
ncbi:BZ3500_MvSof-1268-A1-R1_Chr4-3g07351 [Microbotryum saponariae]|uniref:BZ3500_MvSof-1268-A1-R1_Chr4-3g07351 protein n=1 Tax=Microbotryum saponariae TaxID=289078 RepID=A0A2X0L057_9BASI|nr:BZ3500_MvSof-1268-A1-R1_Chr4-3g07351 [Microbotryum saponariae]SDA07014.1 BZ3501_MvSof-1269-A2-R1_Chr4-2g07060 [Microbotryum saponariae]